jgi:hypothetical protein
MKDSVLNTGLSAFAFVAILFVAFQDGGVPLQRGMSQDMPVFTLEKTVVTASRLQ